MAIVQPLVHLNGTSRESLLAGYQQALNAVHAALLSVGEHAAPNARDYYPMGDDKYRVALREHSERLDRLRSVGDELNQILEGLLDG